MRPSVVLPTVAGVAFALYAALRPYADESTAAGVAGVASGMWILAHLLAVLALVLLPVALHVSGLGRAAVVAGVGAVLVLPYYGAETFGLQGVAAQTLADGGTAMPAVTDAIRFGAVQSGMFLAGLLALAAAGVLLAVDVRRRGGGGAGLLLGAALVLFLPQFFGPPVVRIAHGVLVLAGCLVLARTSGLRRTEQESRSW